MADDGHELPPEMVQSEMAQPRRTNLPGQPTAVTRPEEERELWSGRPSRKLFQIQLVKLALVAIPLVTAGIWLGRAFPSLSGWPIRTALILVGLAAVYWFVRAFLTILRHKYKLTTRRLLVEVGFFIAEQDQTDLFRVDDVRKTQNILEWFFDVGTVLVNCPTDPSHGRKRTPDHSADPKIAWFSVRHVDAPQALCDMVYREVSAIRDRRVRLIEEA